MLSPTEDDKSNVDKNNCSASFYDYSMEDTEDNRTPSEFYFACRNNELELVIQLLNERPLENIDRMEPNRSTALHAACFYKHMNIIKLLLDRGFTRLVSNKFDKKPIDEGEIEEIRHLFLRSKLSNRFGGQISYAQEKLIWILVDGNEQTINANRMTDIYKGNRLDYGIFQTEKILQQLHAMAKLDVIQGLLRRAVEEKDCKRLIQAYSAETDFYNQINNYLLTRNEDNEISQFVKTIYCNQKLHKDYSYEGLCYRSILLNSKDELNLYKKNTKIVNRVFISTTRDRQIAEDYIRDRNENKISVMMIFKIGQVYTALNIEKISEFPHEEEVLIMFDNIFKVENVIERQNFYFEIILRESKSNHRR